jgi:type II secretory pathway pseudopilin PulG
VGTLIEIVMPIAVTLAGVIATIIARRLSLWFDLQDDNALRANLETALQAAAGAAYMAAMRGADRVDAVAHGADYLASRMNGTMKALNLPASNLGPMIEARLGSLLASDPTVQGPKP